MRIGRLAYATVGRYVAGSLLVACIAGVSTLVAGLLLHVPLAPLVATWVALWDLIPQIGGAMGGIPFVLLGLTRGAGAAVACATRRSTSPPRRWIRGPTRRGSRSFPRRSTSGSCRW